MTFRMYLIFMSAATLLSWGAWLIVLLNMDPGQAGLVGFALFYLTLFMSLVGSSTLLGVTYRVMLLKRHALLMREVRIAFRHSILLSITAITALVLSGIGSLRWWNVILMIVLISGLEYMFLIGEESRRV